MYENLKTKSQQNYEIAQTAEQSKYFDVAVSRYYYSLFQLVNYVLLSKSKFNLPTYKKDSHNNTFIELRRFANKKYRNILKNDDFKHLTEIDDLKRWRKNADYNVHRLMTDQEFSDQFMKKFKLCYSTILKLCN